ncbi:TetR/AcrR family transcriptional regulator [Roseateles oligotrophus]|uniref:TetR/AcrR family transcriptional regulator n=1 Tax=Roseateles oligotrophus TaxID=1769250 RepID=A0ABT2YL71_9BURK|nr:TetR/AcrR family transcriptional regulator [Roseateles oligotrophus]MCV2370802.1 TetR/AcrR family transcriptional regulator [Roseateles oligotrophus]
MRAAYDDNKAHILDSGRPLIESKGFSAVGLAEILQAAAIPKGSFYHYFASKEDFGRALLERYFLDYGLRLDDLFGPSERSAFDRLMHYWSQWAKSQAGNSVDAKCLVVKLGAEVADLSDSMRDCLRQGTDDVIRRLRDCILSGQEDGSVSGQIEAQQSARMLYQMWLGASLLSKLHRDDSALQAALLVTQKMLAPAHG